MRCNPGGSGVARCALRCGPAGLSCAICGRAVGMGNTPSSAMEAAAASENSAKRAGQGGESPLPAKRSKGGEGDRRKSRGRKERRSIVDPRMLVSRGVRWTRDDAIVCRLLGMGGNDSTVFFLRPAHRVRHANATSRGIDNANRRQE